MKYALRVLLLGLVAIASSLLPDMAQPREASAQVIYVVCRKFNVSKNCYNCSSYFSVRSRAEGPAKCARWGGNDGPYYFPSVNALFSWKIANCTCRGDSDEANEPR